MSKSTAAVSYKHIYMIGHEIVNIALIINTNDSGLTVIIICLSIDYF